MKLQNLQRNEIKHAVPAPGIIASLVSTSPILAVLARKIKEKNYYYHYY